MNTNSYQVQQRQQKLMTMNASAVMARRSGRKRNQAEIHGLDVGQAAAKSVDRIDGSQMHWAVNSPYQKSRLQSGIRPSKSRIVSSTPGSPPEGPAPNSQRPSPNRVAANVVSSSVVSLPLIASPPNKYKTPQKLLDPSYSTSRNSHQTTMKANVESKLPDWVSKYHFEHNNNQSYETTLGQPKPSKSINAYVDRSDSQNLLGSRRFQNRPQDLKLMKRAGLAPMQSERDLSGEEIHRLNKSLEKRAKLDKIQIIYNQKLQSKKVADYMSNIGPSRQNQSYDSTVNNIIAEDDGNDYKSRTVSKIKVQKRKSKKIVIDPEAEKLIKYKMEVKELLQELDVKFAKDVQKKRKECQAVYRRRDSQDDRYYMYEMPTNQVLKQTLKQQESVKQQKILQNVANNSHELEGRLGVNQQKNKSVNPTHQTQAQKYVKNFEHNLDIFQHSTMIGGKTGTSVTGAFSSMFKSKMQTNMVKNKYQEQVQNMMNQAMSKRKAKESKMLNRALSLKLDCFELAKKRASIYQRQEEIDKKTLQTVADTFTKNVAYTQRMKQRIITDDFSRSENMQKNDDPRILYMKRCLESVELNLPILDKIYRKTIVLQDYHLSEGNCQGLADACEHLDTQIVNRMLFNNCGLTGDTLAVILEGIQKMKDFKALIYCRQTLNANSISNIIPLLERRIPYHLEELSFVDTKMSATLIEQLIDALIESKSEIKKFTLVDVHHSDRSFEKVTLFVQEALLLKELDLSWSSVRPQSMLKLLKVIQHNRYLTNLSLSYNCLMEEQPKKLTTEQIIAGETEVKLTTFNQEMVSCFKDFIKYNTHLIHLNLERCGLIEPAIKSITALLRKSQALRCLHLCGNEGLSPDLVEWIRTRIHAKADVQQRLIRPISAQNGYSKDAYGTNKDSPMKRGLMKIHRGLSLEHQELQDGRQEWKDIRAGLKLRNIVQSMKINDLSAQLMPGMELEKCIIQRHLGHKDMMPGAAQWGIFTKNKDECWVCGQFIMTVFIWNPRVGLIAGERDATVRNHYETAIEKERKHWKNQPGHFDGTPYIMGQFTNWQPVRMLQIRPYVTKNDPLKPDFLQECVNDGTVRYTCVGPDAEKLTDEEHDAVIQRTERYYTENWHRALQSLLRYQNPAVANADSHTLMSWAQNPNEPRFFYCEFLKPGKQTYLVEHKPANDNAGEMEDIQAMSEIVLSERAIGKVSDKPTLYVHNMLTQCRQEAVIDYHNPRHVKRFKTDKVQVKHVFGQFHEDSPDTIEKISRHDWALMLIDRVVDDPKQQQRIQNELICNMTMLKDIYHHLQSKSKSYPYVDANVFKEELIDKIGLGKKNLVTTASLFNICLETCVQGERRRGVESAKRKTFQRYQLFEILIRMSIFLFNNEPQTAKARTSLSNTKKLNEWETLSAAQSWFIFVEYTLKPYYERMQIQWQAFRDEQLWQHEIEMVFTLNEAACTTLFKKYCKKSSNALTLADYEEMFVENTSLPITKAMILEAFSMSHSTVIKESEQKSMESYSSSQFFEFLEIIARVSTSLFKDTEMESEPLKWKLEHVLKKILWEELHEKLTHNEIIIEEFSDSDDDY